MRKTTEKRGKRIYAERIVLRTLASAGLLTVAVLAPNAIGALKKIDPHWEEKIDPRLRVSHALYRLKKKGLLKGSEKGFVLTEKGENMVRELEEGRVRIKRPFRWDGRWRIVIFDVAEKKRGLRDRLRLLLQEAGFIRLQNSVWVHPYDCEEVVALIKSSQRLGGEVQYIVADVIEKDERLRAHFNLRAN